MLDEIVDCSSFIKPNPPIFLEVYYSHIALMQLDMPGFDNPQLPMLLSGHLISISWNQVG